MSDNTFDREIDDAWTELQDRLTGYVHVMEDDDELVLQSQYDSVDDGLVETAACVRFFAWAGDKVRCEVPSNRFLHPARALTEEEHDRLIELGWNRPRPVRARRRGQRFRVVLPRRGREDAHLLASMTVTVFREIWDLLHPSFLKAITGGRGETPEFGTADVPGPAARRRRAARPCRCRGRIHARAGTGQGRGRRHPRLGRDLPHVCAGDRGGRPRRGVRPRGPHDQRSHAHRGGARRPQPPVARHQVPAHRRQRGRRHARRRITVRRGSPGVGVPDVRAFRGHRRRRVRRKARRQTQFHTRRHVLVRRARMRGRVPPPPS